MKRYAIVSHHIKDQNLQLAGGKILGSQPVHDLVSNYHWLRLDDEHILMLADYLVCNHAALHTHEKVSMLPHIGSIRTIHAHIQKNVLHANKDKHWIALATYFGLDKTHTMEDLLEKVVAKHGALYAISV
jgi:hypothetical protein